MYVGDVVVLGRWKNEAVGFHIYIIFSKIDWYEEDIGYECFLMDESSVISFVFVFRFSSFFFDDLYYFYN